MVVISAQFITVFSGPTLTAEQGMTIKISMSNVVVENPTENVPIAANAIWNCKRTLERNGASFKAPVLTS